MKPTKLQSLQNKVKKMNDRKNGTPETFRNAIYNLGHECFIKALQGKLLEVKYDGTIVDVEIKEEMK
jgi:hypothetical protein